MEKYCYSLYDSARVSWRNRDAGSMVIDAPWLSLEVDIDEEFKPNVDLLAATATSAPSMSEFLSGLKDYPLLNVLPRPIAAFVGERYQCQDNPALHARGPADFAKQFLQAAQIDAAERFEELADKWSWNATSVLAAVAIPDAKDLYDPYATYTAIRELRLKYQAQQQPRAQALLDHLLRIRDTDPEKFFKQITVVLAQQYYVTRECCSCLEPALTAHALIKEQIEAYIAEEISHDKLILRSINAISDATPGQFEFMPSVRLEIELIKQSAQSCAVSFACLVSLMEGTVYPENDPLGTLLSGSSKPQAAEGVEKHFQINKRFNHTAIPETFVAALPAIDANTVITALRFMEATVAVDSGLMEHLHRKFIA
jgi:hypothetical protein